MAGNDNSNNCSLIYDSCTVVGSKVISTGRWNHLAVTKSVKTIRFYYDGVFSNSDDLPVSGIGYDDEDETKYGYIGTARDPEFYETGDFNLGTNEYASAYIDEFRFYNRKLETSEI